MGAKRRKKKHPATATAERLERTVALALMNVARLEPNADKFDTNEKRCALAELVHGLAPRVSKWELLKQ